MTMDAELRRLAAEQDGLFTTSQAASLGISPTMLATRSRHGQIVRIEPRIYRIAGAPVTWRQRVRAAAWTSEGLASHRTAAAAWQLEGFRPGVVEVLTERWRRRPNASFRLHETRLLDPEDRAAIDGIAVTSVARTLCDLPFVVPASLVEPAMDDALARKLTTPESIWRCVERLDHPRRPWIAVTRRLVSARLGHDGAMPNAFEQRLYGLLAAAGIPLPEPQVEILLPDGTTVRVDWAYMDCKVLLECDSALWHGSWVRRKRDLRRDRKLTALGYRVLRVSWEDVTDRGHEVVDDVLGARRAASA